MYEVKKNILVVNSLFKNSKNLKKIVHKNKKTLSLSAKFFEIVPS
jgi:hypothetical protein